jgi:hypothetical protein
MKTKNILLLIITVIAILTVTGCANQPYPSANNPPGFFTGIYHGFITLFGFVGSIFADIRIYSFPNSGVMYDLGYLIGLSAFVKWVLKYKKV